MKREDRHNEKDKEPDFDELWRLQQEESAKKWEKRRRAWYNWSKEAENDKTKAYTPWLVIPADYADYGIRPLTVPHWRSPFIYPISPDPSGKPKAGKENFLVAEVFNLGMATSAPTKVDFYWADPSVGLGPNDFNHIGTEWVEVPPMGKKVVKCNTPWIPEFLNNGHECVMVNTDNTILDPIHAPFFPKFDRHVGQKNMTVLPADQPKFAFWAAFGKKGAKAELRVVPLRVKAINGFQRMDNNFMTLINTANTVLTQQKLMMTGDFNTKELFKLGLDIERFNAREIVKSVRMTKDRRDIKGRDALELKHEYGKDSLGFGDLLMVLDDQPGVAARMELDLANVDLGMDEMIVLEIGHVVNGIQSDGYTLVIANQKWMNEEGKYLLKKSNQIKSSNMKNRKLEAMIIERNHESRIAYQVVKQLERYLPIKSLEHVAKQIGDGIVVDDQRLKMEMFNGYIPKEVFPIENLEDLVIKICGATKLALDMVTKGKGDVIQNSTVQDILKTGIGQNVNQSTPIPAGHFTGPSIYGYELSKKQ